MIIQKTSFPDGFNLSGFHAELIANILDKDGVSKVGSLKFDLTKMTVQEVSKFTQTDIDLVNSLVIAHVPYIKSELETMFEALLNVADYHKARSEINDLFVDFSSLNAKEKQYAAKFCIADDNTCVGYYMGLGYDLTDAMNLHLSNRANDINNAAKSCRYRSESPIVLYSSIKYLTEQDAATFIDAIRTFITDYSTIAHLGLNYGQSREGIMDYIEATNAYLNSGLSVYSIKAPYTYEEFKTELKNYIVYGIEPEEFNLFIP